MALDLNLFKMGYIILYKKFEKDFVGELIKNHQLSMGFSEEAANYTHVEISGGGQWAVNVKPPHTTVDDITKVHKGRSVRLLRILEKDFDARTRYKIAFWAASNCNKKYDWWGIVKFKLPFLFHKLDRFFCSENTIWAIRKEHYDFLFPLDTYEVVPAHFYEDKNLELVWEGVIE